MLIKAISQDKAIGLLQEWNGTAAGGKASESERMFRAMCDRYVLIEVESIQELNKLDSMERYLTGGHGFFVYLRYPADVVEAIRRGMASMPDFFRRAEERYSSAFKRGNLKVLIGLLQEKVDQNFDPALFIDLIDNQKKAREEAARLLQAQEFYARNYYTQQAQQPAQPQSPQPAQPAQAPQSASQPQQNYQPGQPTVVHYHFADQN